MFSSQISANHNPSLVKCENRAHKSNCWFIIENAGVHNQSTWSQKQLHCNSNCIKICSHHITFFWGSQLFLEVTIFYFVDVQSGYPCDMFCTNEHELCSGLAWLFCWNQKPEFRSNQARIWRMYYDVRWQRPSASRALSSRLFCFHVFHDEKQYVSNLAGSSSRCACTIICTDSKSNENTTRTLAKLFGLTRFCEVFWKWHRNWSVPPTLLWTPSICKQSTLHCKNLYKMYKKTSINLLLLKNYSPCFDNSTWIGQHLFLLCANSRHRQRCHRNILFKPLDLHWCLVGSRGGTSYTTTTTMTTTTTH